MNFNNIKKGYLIIGGILLFFILTNPSLKDFKERTGASSYDQITRRANFFVASIYKYEDGDYYIGILGNFIDISYGTK